MGNRLLKYWNPCDVTAFVLELSLLLSSFWRLVPCIRFGFPVLIASEQVDPAFIVFVSADRQSCGRAEFYTVHDVAGVASRGMPTIDLCVPENLGVTDEWRA